MTSYEVDFCQERTLSKKGKNPHKMEKMLSNHVFEDGYRIQDI